MPLVSMKKKEDNEAMEVELYNEYGYGLCIHLDEDQCDALGITALPKPGTEVMIRAKCLVTRTMIEDDGEGDENHLDLQITDMEIEGAVSKTESANLLYGG